MEGKGLLNKAVELLKNRHRSIKGKHIAEAIGVSAAWITHLEQGKSKNPGIVRLEKLIAFLENQKH